MLSVTQMLENATRTYNGKTGCACGCGGDYAEIDTEAGQKRIRKIMKADLAKLQNYSWGSGEGCVELENANGTRVTRIYYKVEA